ncbi:hypothetical protein, partial [Burkholderia sp.]|uniref:hypothetical protein n=1 Tax=Burkholderia sp. TaxID=36773 RepID=UPI00258F364E
REKLAPAACNDYFQDEIVRVLHVFCNGVSRNCGKWREAAGAPAALDAHQRARWHVGQTVRQASWHRAGLR